MRVDARWFKASFEAALVDDRTGWVTGRRGDGANGAYLMAGQSGGSAVVDQSEADSMALQLRKGGDVAAPWLPHRSAASLFDARI